MAFQDRLQQFRRGLAAHFPFLSFGILVELLVLVLWGAWAAREWVILDPQRWITGNEFILGIHSHFIWEDIYKCGACFLWNGNINGGNPAFVESQGAPLNPLVFIPILLLRNTINGTKITILLCMLAAGLAQWWLARLIGVGRVARLWVAGMAMVGSNLIGRMEFGLVSLMLSVATGSLVIPAAASLALYARKRDAVFLALAGTLCILSGQGYIQVALPFVLGPALLFFLLPFRQRGRPALRLFLLSGGLMLLLSAPFLVPLIHFLPHFDKFLDPTMSPYQPLKYLPLNLVIDDVFFFQSNILGKQPYPYLYVNYIGWIPVIFGLIALRLVPSGQKNHRWILFLSSGLILSFLTASGLLYRIVFGYDSNITAGLRNGEVAAALAVPFLLGLSGWGVDRLLRLAWPRIQLTIDRTTAKHVLLSSQWLLAIPLIWSLLNAETVMHNWLSLSPPPPKDPAILHFRTDDTQWIETPYGKDFWMESAHEAGLKDTMVVRPWFWNDRVNPPPYLLGVQGNAKPPAGYSLVDTVSDISIYRNPDNVYASVQAQDGKKPCRANALDGMIDVVCSPEDSGTLTVMENLYDGWQVAIDGRPASLIPGSWLMVNVPGGSHVISFRYQPWDVPIALLLACIGLLLSAWIWWSGRNDAPLPSFPDSESTVC